MVEFDEFVKWLSDNWVFDEKIKVTSYALIEKDLRITGDDGADLLLDIEKRFNISFTGEDGTIREAFGIQDNEYLFHSEGCNSFSFLGKWFGKEETIIPLTVGQLYNVITSISNKIIFNDAYKRRENGGIWSFTRYYGQTKSKMSLGC